MHTTLERKPRIGQAATVRRGDAASAGNGGPETGLSAARKRATLERRVALAASVCVALAYLEFLRHALTLSGGTKGDFLAFYDAACAMVRGGDLYAPRHRNYIYPPLVAMLYMPLTAMGPYSAGIVALLANVAMSAGTLWALAGEAWKRLARGAAAQCTACVPVVMAIALALVADKVRSELRMWQTNALMLLLMAMGWRWLERRPGWAGVALGLAVNVKYLPVFFLPWLLARRRFGAAAGMVAGIAAGALAPALWVGWARNLAYLRTGFGGLLALVGIDPGPGERAGVEGMADDLSVSLTSAIARWAGGSGHERVAMAAAGLAALLVCAGIAAAYRRAGVPVLAWPSSRAQRTGSFRTLIALEWCVLIIGMLVFGPQTNTRHLYLLMAPAAMAAAMILSPAGTSARSVLLIGAVDAWRRMGGPSMGMLVMLGCLVWAALAAARAELRMERGDRVAG